MFTIVASMLVVLALAALVVGYVAFPYRGEDLPGAAGLGKWMRRRVDELPTLEDDDVPLGHR